MGFGGARSDFYRLKIKYMNRFEYSKVSSVEEAIEMMNSTASDAIIKTNTTPFIVKGGGTDLFDLIKEGIIEPGRVIDLGKIPGLDKISYAREKGLEFGPMVTIAGLAEDEDVMKKYRAVHEAALHTATPQIRNMGTMGGNLMQRPRCWYFRSSEHKCRKKGGNICFAQVGQNQFHGIFNTAVCPCVHPSSIATALVAFDGKVELTGPEGKRVVPMAEFFTASEHEVTKENVAESREVITNILLPPVDENTRSFYIKHGQRESYDWSIGDVAVVLKMKGKRCQDARIILGAASSIPFRVTDAENVLKGKKINEKLAVQAGEAAVMKATPLQFNRYKVQLFKTLVKRTIMAAVG
jgi:xanthine dehydrogenase YagS FAD-binding subunit